MSKKRTYLDSYVQYGFDFIVVDGVEKPQCLLCSKVFENGSLKPSILKQHLEATHPAHASYDCATFEANRVRFRSAGTLPKLGFVSEKKPMLAASYLVAMRIAKAKKPHDIANKLIKPCALDMVEHVRGNKEKQKIQAIPLSNDTIHQHIIEMSQDICQQVVEQIKSSPAKISLQLDESCDNDLTWDIVGSICTDGAPAMMGVRSSFTALVKQKAPHVITTHYVLHRHVLAARTLSENLKIVLQKEKAGLIFANFPNLDEERYGVLPEMNEDITENLKILKNHFIGYFSKDMILTERWIIRPFANELSEMKDDDPAIQELIDLQSSATLREEFEKAAFLTNYAADLGRWFPGPLHKLIS
ncbi:protein ZBED8-like [Limulus polyphemus]|uniref:Protein ZBED8-like n=1 Tax=Limulus polyphemus TaxID=6850 RepID=A0ABM1BJK7_LIMPO|nr:protein ZBED8-like [Limulus polyphemus]